MEVAMDNELANVLPPRKESQDLAAFVDRTTLDIDWHGEAADGDYRSLIRKGKAADYESLV